MMIYVHSMPVMFSFLLFFIPVSYDGMKFDSAIDFADFRASFFNRIAHFYIPFVYCVSLTFSFKSHLDVKKNVLCHSDHS